MIPKIKNMGSHNGNPVPNQFIIEVGNARYFKSYDSIIAVIENRQVKLDENYWDYSNTTGKYRNMFLGETKKETERKIASGEYILCNLNA